MTRVYNLHPMYWNLAHSLFTVKINTVKRPPRGAFHNLDALMLAEARARA